MKYVSTMKYIVIILMVGLFGCAKDSPLDASSYINNVSSLSGEQKAIAVIVGSDRFSETLLATQKNHTHDYIQFDRLQEALESFKDNTETLTIYLAEGVYREKIIITRDNLVISGAGAGKTKIVMDDYAGRLTADGQAMGTGGSATVTITGKNIHISGLTIENDFDFLKQDKLDANAAEKVNQTQAVALYTAKGSDKVRLVNVSLLGFQDTLFADGERAYISESYIAGNVDFIFGKSNLLIENSEIHTRERSKINVMPHSFITAGSTNITQNFGITCIKCRLTRHESVPDKSVALGRPWHPTTTFADGRYADPNAVAKVVFIDSWMDAHILEEGWYWMGGTAKDGSKVPMLAEDARFFETGSQGPGALISDKRWQLPQSERAQFTRENILGDWDVAASDAAILLQ